MSWVAVVADRIRQNLKWSPVSDAMKSQILAEAIEAFDAPPAPEETKPQDAPPLTARGETLADLRRRAVEWAGWEDWRK
jgi:hypothetical protein